MTAITMEGTTGAGLADRVARWVEAEGIAAREDAPGVTAALLESPAAGRAAAALRDGTPAPQVLRDAAVAVAAVAGAGDENWFAEDWRHGHLRDDLNRGVAA